MLLLALLIPFLSHAEERSFTWPGDVKNIDSYRCNLHDWQVREALQNAENTAMNMAVQSGYPHCYRLNPSYYYRERQRECVVISNLMCSQRPSQPGTPCEGTGETRSFPWVGDVKNIDSYRCNLHDWQVREAVRRAEGTAQNTAIQQGYFRCRPLNPTYYYRERQRECVVQVSLLCEKKSPYCRN